MDNYSRYSKVFRNHVWSSMEIIRSYMINNEVIWYRMEPSWFVSEVIYRLEEDFGQSRAYVIIIHDGVRYIRYTRYTQCHIPNSETCLKHVWLQNDIKSLWLFSLICAQNSVRGLILYNRLNSIKSPWLFSLNWVKIHSHSHLFPLPNYLLQTSQIYSDFIHSFPLSKSQLLYSISLLKHSLRDLF